jgi:hypothetical protein
MSSLQVAPVRVRRADSIREEIEGMYNQITRRAYEIFTERGGDCTLHIDDWLAAEQELLIKPRVELDVEPKRFDVEIDVHELDLREGEVLITPADLLFRASTINNKSVFRTVHFSQTIDVDSVKATYFMGKICLKGLFRSEQ